MLYRMARFPKGKMFGKIINEYSDGRVLLEYPDENIIVAKIGDLVII